MPCLIRQALAFFISSRVLLDVRMALAFGSNASHFDLALRVSLGLMCCVLWAG
jgi:hypothetical protein